MTSINKYFIHIVGGKKFNKLQDATEMRTNERTGETSFITTGKCMRTCAGTNTHWYFETSSTVGVLLFISTKRGLWRTRRQLWSISRLLILITIQTPPPFSLHFQNIFYPARVFAAQLCGWNHVTRHKYPLSVYIQTIVYSDLSQRTLFLSEIYLLCTFWRQIH